MEQYFIIVNLDKKEYIHPHNLKYGAKLVKINNDKVIKDLMSFLSTNKWGNDKVIVVGDSEDYALFKQVIDGFKNISKQAYKESILRQFNSS